MLVYLDESGDLGWTFSAPFRNGGSSRFLCLAFLFVPREHRKLPGKVITEMYRHYGWVNEKKAAKATPNQKKQFSIAAVEMLNAESSIRIDCIIAKKENVQSHIRSDGNKLYNYMCGLVVPEYVSKLAECEFIPDKRSIKVESGNCLSDYLQTKLWFDHQVATVLRNSPQESHKNHNLQFVDWVANIVWSHFEDGEAEAFGILNRKARIRRLYF